MAAVEADADAIVAAAELDEAGELVEVAADRPGVAGGVLEQQRAALGIGEDLVDGLADRLHTLLVVRTGLRARMEHDARGADAVAEAKRVGQRRERLGADLAVSRGGV